MSISIDAITPAYDFSPMSPTLKRLVELAVQARRDAAFLGLELESGRSGHARPPEGSASVETARPETPPAPFETGRLDLRA
jgi:hypothetical protein